MGLAIRFPFLLSDRPLQGAAHPGGWVGTDEKLSLFFFCFFFFLFSFLLFPFFVFLIFKIFGN
jgi:hypothetical protein